jgi:hypothetical protein
MQSLLQMNHRIFWMAGLFMALQPRLIACGKSNAIFGMVLRFLTGPAVMAVASIASDLRGRILHIAIVQVRSFVFDLFSFSLLTSMC